MGDAPILICYDGSAAADHAIDAAADLLNDRRAVVLDVAEPMTLAEGYAVGPIPADLQDVNRESALKRARAGAEIARRAGLNAEARTEVDAPTWAGVVGVADELGAAAIVIGSRGLTGARRLLAGSLSRDVAEHAGRPVLIVPPRRLRPRRSGAR
jgi:nucleotide-binding universal stress UspA family protein